MHRGWRLGLAGIAVAAAVSFACETPTSAPAEPSPPRDPNGCMYNDRYYSFADYPDEFLDEQGCNRCGCGNERAPSGCQMLTCDVEQATAAKRAGPSRLSLDKVSCKVVAERLVLDDDKRGWTMFVDGTCHGTTLRVTVRGSVALEYPQVCRESASADVARRFDAQPERSERQRALRDRLGAHGLRAGGSAVADVPRGRQRDRRQRSPHPRVSTACSAACRQPRHLA